MAKGQVAWRPLSGKRPGDEGNVIDHYSTSEQPATTAEGYRLVWYRSLRKTEADAVARSGRIDKALKQLAVLAGKAPLAADPLPSGSQTGRGRGGNPRVVRGQIVDRNRSPSPKPGKRSTRTITRGGRGRTPTT